MEIQYKAAGGRGQEKWVTERRYGEEYVANHPTGAASALSLTWDSLVSTCAGRSWRLVSITGGNILVERGPTEVIPGEPWGPAPGSASVIASVSRTLPFEVRNEAPRPVPAAFRRRTP